MESRYWVKDMEKLKKTMPLLREVSSEERQVT